MYSEEKIRKMIAKHDLQNASNDVIFNIAEKMKSGIKLDEDAKCGLWFAGFGIGWYLASRYFGNRQVKAVREELESFGTIKEE